VARRTLASAVRRGATGAALALAIALAFTGCSATPAPIPPQAQYPDLPNAKVPEFMQQTLFERVRFTNTREMPVYGYSLVVNLHNTGDSTAPGFVRNYIFRQIMKSGFGSVQLQYKNLTPEQILSDNRVAIVTVEGMLPVGARADQRFDILVKAQPQSHTTSLAHGELYRTDLNDHGLQDPSAAAARSFATVLGGPVFVNPAYAVSDDPKAPGSKSSLRTGTVLNAGVSRIDREINLQLRHPQVSTARRIEALIQKRWNDLTPERRLNGRWAGTGVARAEDEGLVQIYVPLEYKGDWRHFVGVVSHLYMNDSPAFVMAKAKELVGEAHKPNAPLKDISLCWEGLGEEVIPVIAPLMTDPNPDIAFAATRAAAFMNDVPARHELLRLASDSTQRYQIEAVQTLGALLASPDTMHMLRTLLNSDKADVRIAAYRILAENNDEGIITTEIADSFYLDVIPSSGPPLVYATNTGVPRIAIFGHDLKLQSPLTFTAMQTRFSLSSSDGTSLLTMFYRDPNSRTPISELTDNDLPEIIARLGGKGPDGMQLLSFDFNDVVGIVQQLIETHQAYGQNFSGQALAAVFQLEHPQLAGESWISIPEDTEAGRPQGDGSGITPANPDAAPAKNVETPVPAAAPVTPKTAGAQAASNGNGG
jgi:flagellar basal body P-ring protein FlgI